MEWWIATVAVWLISFALILAAMLGSSRRNTRMHGWVLYGAVGAHGVTAILALVLFFRAVQG